MPKQIDAKQSLQQFCETIFNIVKPMTHKTRKTVKVITLLHYLTNSHHVINKTA